MRELFKNYMSPGVVDLLLKDYPTPKLLLTLTDKELDALSYLGRQQVRFLSTALQLCRLMLVPEKPAMPVYCPLDVLERLQALALQQEEQFHAIYLDRQGRVIDMRKVVNEFMASSDTSLREFYTPGVRLRAYKAIAVHIHTGNAGKPDTEDFETAGLLQKAGKLLGIKLLDYIVIAGGSYSSFKEDKFL